MKALMLALLMVVSLARAEFINLEGGDVLAQAKCMHNNKQFVCVAVSFENNVYVVLLDQKGEYAIYLVKETESVLIWSRDTV